MKFTRPLADIRTHIPSTWGYNDEEPLLKIESQGILDSGEKLPEILKIPVRLNIRLIEVHGPEVVYQREDRTFRSTCLYPTLGDLGLYGNVQSLSIVSNALPFPEWGECLGTYDFPYPKDSMILRTDGGDEPIWCYGGYYKPNVDWKQIEAIVFQVGYEGSDTKIYLSRAFSWMGKTKIIWKASVTPGWSLKRHLCEGGICLPLGKIFYESFDAEGSGDTGVVHFKLKT